MAVEINLVLGNGYLYPLGPDDLESLKNSGIGFTRFPHAAFDCLAAQYVKQLKFMLHPIDSVYQMIVDQLSSRMDDAPLFKEVQWKHLSGKAPSPVLSLDGELVYFVRTASSDEDAIALMTGQLDDDHEDPALDQQAAMAVADEMAHALSHYLGRYQISVETRKRSRPELGGTAYKFTYRFDADIANNTFYGDTAKSSDESVLNLTMSSRLLFRIEQPNQTTGNSSLGRVLSIAVQTKHGDNWESNPNTVRSYPVRMVDRASVPPFISFLTSHLS